MSRQEIPAINAGSMADIAFLLLIFFLVTTTMDVDAGISRKLPPKLDSPPIIDKFKRNVFIVNINKKGKILVNNDSYMNLNELKREAKLFLDNAGGFGNDNKLCDYCEGDKLDKYSVHPNKTIISLQSSRKTKHGDYIAVTNKIVRAYNELRNRESKKLYQEFFTSILAKAKKNPKNKILKTKVETVKKRFPMLFSEAEPLKIE